MAFDIHPAAPAVPLPVGPNQDGPPTGFTELASTDPVTGRTQMFLRVAQHRADGAAVPPPTLALAADDGPITPIRSTPTGIDDGTSSPDDPAAIAVLDAGDGGVFPVTVELVRPGRAWRLRISNTDPAADCRYTWVVADSDGATRRPWAEISPTILDLACQTGDEVDGEITLSNLGTGPLTVADPPDGAELSGGFRLNSVTPRTVAPHQRATARVVLTAPAQPGAVQARYAPATDDPDHRVAVELHATVSPRPVLVSVVPGPGAHIDHAALSPDGRRIVVWNSRLASVNLVDTATNAVTPGVAVGQRPSGVGIAPHGGHAYVANKDSSSVSVLDLVTGTVVDTVEVPGHPVAVAVAAAPPSTELAYVTLDAGNLAIIERG
jgi:YVTN family beta-propeller protein